MHNRFTSHPSRLALVICALATPALLARSVARADTCSSWHIELSTQLSNAVFDEDGNLVSQDATGEGRSSHVGRMSVVGRNYFSPPVDGLLVVDGDGVFTAVNGDKIFVNFDGTVIDLATGTGTGTYVITGGTGRFQSATGSADVSSSPLDPDGFTAVADGTLCL